MKPDYSLIIPVYNSSKILEELSARITKVFDISIKKDFEVLFIDDCSMDNSWEVIEKINAKDKRFKGIQLMKNFGQQNAVFCGFSHALGEYVITMDDDLQHSPEDIPKLIKAMEKSDADVVFAEFKNKKHSIVQNMGRRCLDYINSIVFSESGGVKLSSFRIIKRSVIDEAIKRKTNNPTIGPLLLTITPRVVNVAVSHSARRNSRSGYSFIKIMNLALDVIVNNSSLPLKIASAMGFIASLLAFFLGIYFIILYYTRMIILPGWTSLIVINLFFSGATLFFMGMIGEYLIRITHQIKDYPAYIVRKKVG